MVDKKTVEKLALIFTHAMYIVPIIVTLVLIGGLLLIIPYTEFRVAIVLTGGAFVLYVAWRYSKFLNRLKEMEVVEDEY